MRAILLPLVLAGCTSSDMAESWQLDRLRILAVRAEPAEPRPGETVAFSSLLYLPEGAALDGVIWFACLPESADDFGCMLSAGAFEDFAEVDPADLSPEELAELMQAAIEAGLIGFEPFLPPSWTAPADALDGLDEREQIEGVSAVVNVTAIPSGAEDEGDLELAYKRVPVSLAVTPNENPDIAGLLVDGEPAGPDTPFAASRGKEYDIEPVLGTGAVETYTYVSSDGETEERTEEPYFTWYAEGGAFYQPFSLYPHSKAVWTAPESAWEGLVVVVMRDRRGGMAWSSFTATVD